MDMKIEEGTESPQTVGEAREAVERSRQRISSTLDALEERIVEKKHEIKDRVDVMRPVRERISERPFTAVAIGLGVGAFLGALGGGDDDGDVHRRRSGRVSGRLLEDDDREELKEWRRARRRRLRAAMRRSEAERGEVRSGRGRDEDDSDDSRFDALKHQLMGAITSAVTTAITKRVRRMATENVGSLVDSVIGGDDHGSSTYQSDGRPGRSAGRDDRMGRPSRHAERESYP
jgi:ElaB/YqjD/DUF883 family membrane-anchored ribosome-binding protein